MMNKQWLVCDRRQPGYILVFSMIFISTIVALSFIISNRSIFYTNYSKFFVNREKAKMLARSGLQIAMAQLAMNQNPDKGAKDTVSGSGAQQGKAGSDATKLWSEKEAKDFIKTIWPNMYKWQEFKFKADKWAVDGSIRICIGAEEGKLNINYTYNFEEKKFVGQDKKDGDYKKLYENIFKKMGSFVKAEKAFESFENYLKDKKLFEKVLKNRQNLIFDVTEFMRLDAFSGFIDRIFYSPVEKITEKGKTTTTLATIYWTDIFTISSGNNKINPWFISPSLKKLLGFKDLQGAKKIENIANNYNENISFPADWDKIFEPIFGVKYANLPEWLRFALGTKFEPKFFCVLAEGSFGGVTNRIFAIIERKKEKSGKSVLVKFNIKKLFNL